MQTSEIAKLTTRALEGLEAGRAADVAAYKQAQTVIGMLDSHYSPATVTGRPAGLWMDSKQMAELLLRYRAFGKIDAQETGQMQLWGRWRREATFIEGNNAGRLQSLLMTIRDLGKLSHQYPGTSEIEQMMLRLVSFVASQYGVRDLPADIAGIRRVPLSACRNARALPEEWRDPSGPGQ